MTALPRLFATPPTLRFDRRCVALWLGLYLTTLLGGCMTLDVPRAEAYAPTGQKKARAVHHWDVLADDVAQRVSEKIQAWPVGEYPIYIPRASESSFNEGFRKLLIARLLDRGVVLSTEPTTVELAFDTQLVQHEAPVSNSLPLPWTRVAAGVSVARDWYRYAQGNPTMIGSALALGMLVDASQLMTQGSASGGPTRTEVLITTTLSGTGRYLASTADVYYIEAEDSVLYRPKPPAPVVVAPVVAPPPPTTKNWKVVAP